MCLFTQLLEILILSCDAKYTSMSLLSFKRVLSFGLDSRDVMICIMQCSSLYDGVGKSGELLS